MRLFNSAVLSLLLCAIGAQAADYIIPHDGRAPFTNALPWSMVGYRWQQDHPTSSTVTNHINIVTDYSADNTGVTQCDTAMTSAMAAVARGHAIYFPAGTYLFTNSIYVFNNQSFVIRGAGSGLTKFYSKATTSSGNAAIRFQGSSDSSTVVTADALRGTTNISVTSTSGFAPGKYVILQETTNDFDRVRGRMEHPTAALHSQWNEVHAISAGTVTLKKPIYRDFKNTNTTILYRRSPMTNVAVEGITIEQEIKTGAAVRGVLFFQCVDFWANDVVVTNSGAAGIVSDFSFRGTFRACKAHTAQTNAQSNYAFQITDASSDILIEDCAAYRHSSGFLIQYAEGCVVGYNYSPAGSTYSEASSSSVRFGIITHGDASAYNLFEGNVASRAAADNYWGNNDYTYWLRNWMRGYQVSENGSPAPDNRNTLHIDETNYYHSVVGNIIGYQPTNGIVPILLGGDEQTGSLLAGDDPQVAATTFLHGNYDITSKVYTYSNTFGTTVPSSYYLSSKPAWFGRLEWPVSYSTNEVTLTNTLAWNPAQARFEGVDYTTMFFTNSARSTRLRGWRGF